MVAEYGCGCDREVELACPGELDRAEVFGRGRVGQPLRRGRGFCAPVEHRGRQAAERAGRVIPRRALAERGGSRRAAAAAAQSAVGEDPYSDRHDEHRGDSRRRHGGGFADPLPESRERVAEPALCGAAALHSQPQFVVETGTGPRRLERVVQLTLQGLNLELLFLLAHALSFWTSSRKALNAR